MNVNITERKPRLVRVLSNNIVILFFGVVFLIALFFVPKFNDPSNLYNILVQSSDLIILACGTTFVFVNGGIDFSVTAILPAVSVFGAMVMTRFANPAAGILLGVVAMLAIALMIGAINGLAVSRLGMPSFMATMATQLIFSGIALTVTQSKSIGGLPKAFLNFNKLSIAGIRIPLLVAALVVIVLAYLLNKTVYGRQLIAVGINQRVSEISGINVRKIVFSIFIVSAVCSSIAGIIMTARLGSGVPALGEDMLMDVVAAVVIGGTSNTGGEGKIIGSVFGAVIVTMLSNALNLLGIDWYYITACKGILIIGISLLISWRKKLWN